MTDDDWVNVAMTDDSIVVQLLINLNQSSKLTPLNPTSPSPPPFKWTVRQRRSKSVFKIAGGDDTKDGSSSASPTTPLSWSGGSYVSSAAVPDGAGEELSRRIIPCDGARSKVAGASDTTSNKRSRKKKTLVDLRQEESALLQERTHLKNELASLRSSVEKQRATNESLKRIKFDMESHSVAKTVATSLTFEDQERKLEALCEPMHSDLSAISIAYNASNAALYQASAHASIEVQKNVTINERLPMLPDLNLPCEEVYASHNLCGVSRAN